MSSKLKFSLIFVFAVSMVGAVGCELQGTTDGDATTNTTDTRNNTGNDTNIVGTDTNTNTGCSLPEGCLDYKFIRIDDLSDQLSGEDPGADIDAVVLVKASGQRIFADDQLQYNAGMPVRSGNPDEAVGAPDGFENYPNDTGTCNLYKDLADCQGGGACDPTFVSLGGPSGYLVVSVPEKIERGDTIQVLEFGNCEFESSSGNTGTAKEDEIQVQVSVSDDINGSWVVVLDNGTGPVVSAQVPALPEVSAN